MFLAQIGHMISLVTSIFESILASFSYILPLGQDYQHHAAAGFKAPYFV